MAAGNQIASLFVALGADTRALENGLKKSESLLARTAGSFAKAGQALTLGLTLPLVGVGLGAAKMAIDFDSAMMGVNSVLKLSEDSFQSLKGEILAFSTETSKSSADVAIALRGIVSTGFESAEAMEILKVAVDSAGNMMVDTSTTTLALTSTLKAFGMEAGEVTHVADVLQTAANNSAIQFDLLTTSIGTALGSASAAGVSFEETAAALMTITDAGYSTQIATTNLNAVISALLKPGEDLTTMIAAWGYESGEAALKAIGLQGVMTLLAEATGGSASELAVLLPNVRAFKGAVALAREGGDAFADSLGEIAAASVGAGEHAAMAAIRHESWAYQITKLKSEIEVFAIRMADTFMPAVIDVVNVLTEWATKLATLPPELIKTIVKVGLLVAAVGPLLLLFSKLIAIGGAVIGGLSSIASGVSLVVTAVGILTGASTMLGAALMTIAPIAVVAGLALLAKKVYDNIQAHKEFAAEAIHTASTFTQYRQAVEDSDRWTTTLSEGVWKLVQAQIELQGATGEVAAALAAEGIEQQKLLDAMQKAAEIQAGMSGHIAREVYERGEAAKAIILQDAALREVALAMGLVTQAEYDLVAGVEASDRAMLEFAKNTQELREQTGFYAEAIKNVSAEQEQLNEQMARTSAQTERAAQITKTSLDEMAAAAKEARESLGKTFEDLGSTISAGYEQMQESAETYHAAMLSAQAGYDEQIARIAESGAQAQFLALEKYQLSQAQALAKYEAEAAALSAAGQTDRLADLTRSFDESSTMAQYAFDMAEAQREQSEAIQTHVAQVAQAQREYDAALSHFNELSELQKFIGNKIMMWIALHKSEIDIAGGSADDMLRTVGEMFGSQLSLADQFNIGWKAFMKDWAEDSGRAIEGAAKYWEGLHQTMKGELDRGAATMAAAQSKLDAIGAGWKPPVLQAPAMPDFGQWTQDYSSGVSRGGSQIRESATKTLQQVTVDIAKAFETAMTVFEKVAGWKPLKGLAAGMKLLREDIQLAVTEMYTAYQALGKDGVEGARDIAGAAHTVVSTFKEALGAFDALPGYARVGKEKIYELGDDIYEAMGLMLDIGARFNNLGHDYRDVTKVSKTVAEGIQASVSWIKIAVEAFASLKDYASPAKASIEALVADLQMIMAQLVAIGIGEVDAARLAWFDYAGKLIGLVTDMISDLETLADFRGGLSVSADAVLSLLSTANDAVNHITQGFNELGLVPIDEAYQATIDMIIKWVQENGKLIKSLGGLIGGLQTLADFDGGLEISQANVENLMWTLDNATGIILGLFFSIGAIPVHEAYQSLINTVDNWLQENGRLVSSLAALVDDLQTLADFEGGLEISLAGLENIMWTLDNATGIILGLFFSIGAIPVHEAYQSLINTVDNWLQENGRLVSSLAALVDDLQTLADFEGGLSIAQSNVENLINTLKDVAGWILDAIGEVAADFNAAEGSVDQLKAAWLEFSGGLISAVASIIEDLGIIARFKGGITAIKANVESLIAILKQTVGWLLTAIGDVADQFDDQGQYIHKLKVAWVKIQKELITALADITEGIETIASFVPRDEAKFKAALDAMFDALYWFLEEFESRTDIFADVVSEVGAEIAELIGDSVKGLGEAIDPLLDVMDFAVTPAEAEAAIGLFFTALELFLTEFEENAIDFGEKADKDAAELATIIGTTLSGIGNAVTPLVNILDYAPEVKDIDAQFEKFFGHLDKALWWIEQEKSKWAVSTEAQELADAVSEVFNSLEDAVDFLDAMATYAEDTITGAEAGFLAFLVDLMLVIGHLNEARAAVEDEALLAAEQFSGDCSTLLGHITDGINTLNSLPQMAVDFYNTGVGLGGSFIDGMIAGLYDNSTALFLAIAAIVQNAIATAEAAAGVASDSKKMWDLGQNMVAGLVGGLTAGQSDVAAAMAGLMGGGMMGGMGMQTVPVMAGGGIGGGAGNTYEYNYNYNESDSITPEGRASLRQQYESMELYSRLRG